MAATTLTATQVRNGPILERKGLNIAHSSLVWGDVMRSRGSLSTSVCLQMIAVPDGARILDVITRIAATTLTEGGYAVGDGSSTARYIATTSLTVSDVVTRAGTGKGFLVSLTASHVPQTYDTIDITFSGAMTSTMTLCVNMTVYYVMDRGHRGEP